jgi:threonine/homoserine/homoserine lactone efflux protein
MVAPDRLLAFVAMALVIIVIPGPAVLFAVGRALTHGRRVALTSALGTAMGTCVLGTLVAFGLGAVVERSILVFTVVKLVGAAYLVYLGIQGLRHAGQLRDALTDTAVPAAGGLRSWRKGFAVGVTNPKTVVFFGAVLPQFLDRDSGSAAAQMLLLALVFATMSLLWHCCWGLAASAARSWLGRSPNRLRAIGRTGGVSLIGLGISVAVTGRPQ